MILFFFDVVFCKRSNLHSKWHFGKSTKTYQRKFRRKTQKLYAKIQQKFLLFFRSFLLFITNPCIICIHHQIHKNEWVREKKKKSKRNPSDDMSSKHFLKGKARSYRVYNAQNSITTVDGSVSCKWWYNLM